MRQNLRAKGQLDKTIRILQVAYNNECLARFNYQFSAWEGKDSPRISDCAQPLLLPVHWAFRSNGPDAPWNHLPGFSLGRRVPRVNPNGAIRCILPSCHTPLPGGRWARKWSCYHNVTSISVTLDFTSAWTHVIIFDTQNHPGERQVLLLILYCTKEQNENLRS